LTPKLYLHKIYPGIINKKVNSIVSPALQVRGILMQSVGRLWPQCLLTKEKGNNNLSDKEFDEWQGLSSVSEHGCTDSSPGCNYNDNCEDMDSITKKWACGKDRSGKWKKYFGRGAKQFSYNFNYGQFSHLCHPTAR
jgi:hypothetical protein